MPLLNPTTNTYCSPTCEAMDDRVISRVNTPWRRWRRRHSVWRTTFLWRHFHLIGHSMTGIVVREWRLTTGRAKPCAWKSVLAVTPVAADVYPAAMRRLVFGERPASAEDALREVIEVAGPGLGRVAFVVDIPDVRHVAFLKVGVDALRDVDEPILVAA